MSIITHGYAGNIYAQSKERPNVVFIVVDDLGWSDLGCYGSTFYETPNIDGLANQGIRFTNAYAASPVCSPTRSSILTGKNPGRTLNTAYFGDLQPEDISQEYDKPLVPAMYKDYLDSKEITLAELMGSAGYKTFFAGKWHLGPEGSWPENHGFQINKGGWTSGGPYGGNKYFSPYENPRLEDGPLNEHLPERLAQETVDFIKDNCDNNFFAFLSFYSVHTPLIGRKDLVEKYRNKKKESSIKDTAWGMEGERKVRRVQNHAIYAAMVEGMDMAVGKVLNTIRDLGLEDNTIVVLTSDNGGLSTSEGHPTSNLPLRAGKGWLYEGGIRVPLIVRWKGHIDSSRISKVPVISTDFYPTILQMTNIPLYPNQHKDGVSFYKYCVDRDLDSYRPPLFFHYPHYGNQGGSPSSAIIHDGYKLILWYEEDRVEFYKIKIDIGEKNDLKGTIPKKEEMYNKLKTWLRDVNAAFPKKFSHLD